MLPRDVEAAVSDFEDQAVRLHEDGVSVAKCVGVTHFQYCFKVVSETVCIGHVDDGRTVEDFSFERGCAMLVDCCGDFYHLSYRAVIART